MVTSIPKRVLIRGILDEYSRDAISGHFHIGAETDLSSRLEDFTKSALLDFLVSTGNGKAKLSEIQKKYPLGRSPTLYLIYVNHRPEFDELLQVTTRISEAGRDGGLVIGESKSVRIVYADQPGYLLPFRNDTIEIPLRYERRFEYNVGDPAADDYGERVAAYSLEQAYIWLVENFSHGIICCNDFVAINPILKYASRLSIECGLPNLTEDMLNQLAANASPRSATFSRPEIEQGVGFDVKTVVVSDPSLEKRNTYLEIKSDASRYQTSGFYSNHPNLAFGGLGISRRYGRIWTPVHLSRNNLVALSVGLIGSTEQELGREYERSSRGYVSYFRNIPAVVGDYSLKGKERDTFDSLLTAILDANKRNSEVELAYSALQNLVKHQSHLGVITVSDFDCPNCSEGNLGKCSQCATPYKAKFSENEIVFECPSCRTTLGAGEFFQCECGEEIQIPAIENHIQIYPDTKLLTSIQHFLNNLA